MIIIIVNSVITIIVYNDIIVNIIIVISIITIIIGIIGIIIIIIISEVNVTQGGADLLRVSVSGLRRLVAMAAEGPKRRWKYFVKLSEYDYPIASPAALQEYLWVHGGLSFVGVDACHRSKCSRNLGTSCGGEVYIYIYIYTYVYIYIHTYIYIYIYIYMSSSPHSATRQIRAARQARRPGLQHIVEQYVDVEIANLVFSCLCQH